MRTDTGVGIVGQVDASAARAPEAIAVRRGERTATYADLYDHYATEHAIGPGSRSLVVSSIGFDLTQKNIWVPLVRGATVVFATDDVFDPTEVATTIAARSITHLNCTPSAFHAILDAAAADRWRDLASLQVVQLGGEPIRPDALRGWWSSPHTTARLINGYGPTEASAVVATHVVETGEALPDPFPIGRPVPGVRLHVLGAGDGDGAAEGELAVAGVQVARGYLHRPDLTAERFIELAGPQQPQRPGTSRPLGSPAATRHPDATPRPVRA